MNIIENPSAEFEREFIQVINARRKLKGNKPKFIVTSDEVVSSNEIDRQRKVLLTVKNLQTFLLSCIDKCPRAYSASWCKILRVQKLQQILVIVLNGMTENQYELWKDAEEFRPWKQLFTSEDVCHQFRFHTQKGIPLIRQFSQIAAKTRSTGSGQDRSLLKTKAEQISQKNASNGTMDENPSKKWKKSSEDQFSRVNLVLSVKQLMVGNYPCPKYNPFPNFKFLKSSYQPVTSTSRIFALDVETFEDPHHHRQIPYWIAIVDENLICVYQTLIRPNEQRHQEIYQQRREQVRKSVETISEKSLDEVHQDLSNLFDDDLILAGHSIENDLKYLQMYHPYLIDTSIIYNITGNRLEKSSLQKLYAVFFGRLIQKTRLEHDPTEDARATMELVQLKLSQNIEFGDWFLGGVDQMKVLGNFDSIQLQENLQECQTFLAQTKFGLQEDFFKRIKQKDQTLIIEQSSSTDRTSLPTIEVDSNRKAMKTCIEQLPNHQFIWLQLSLSSSDDPSSMKKLKKYFEQIYQTLREDSILIGILSGEEEFGQCFIRIKDEEKFLPLIIDGKEYPFNLKLIKSQSQGINGNSKS